MANAVLQEKGNVGSGRMALKRSALLLTIGAAVAGLASASARADNIAWGSKTGELVWSSVGNWLSADNTSLAMGRLPTADDDVFLWAGGLTTAPLVVDSGTEAVTRGFSISYLKDAGTGNTRDILFEIADGGKMTNEGPVVLGDISSGATSGRAVSGSATVRSGGSWTANAGVTVGGGMTPTSSNLKTSRILIETNADMTQTAGEFIIGNVAGYAGVVTNQGTMAAYDFFVGGYGNGEMVNDGDLTVANKFVLARQAGSSGTFIHRGGTITHTGNGSQALRVGNYGTGLFRIDAPLAFVNEMVVVGNQSGSKGTLVVNEALSGLKILKLGENAGSEGLLELNGASITVNATTAATTSESGHAVWVGSIDETADSDNAQKAVGTIRGFGKIGRTDVDTDEKHARIKVYGKIIADGGDLDLGLFRVVGLGTVDANKSGANGWYAKNGGRLIYPRRLPVSSANHIAVGEFGTNTGADGNRDLSLVNSLQVKLVKDGAAWVDYHYNYAMLYAPDRADIPGTIPCATEKGDKVIGVWRLGHFQDIGDVGAEPQTPDSRFDSVNVRIRFDDAGIDWGRERVVLYRWNGSAWKRVGGATEGVYVETAAPQSRYKADANDNWNIGWYAVVRKQVNGIAIILR